MSEARDGEGEHNSSRAPPGDVTGAATAAAAAPAAESVASERGRRADSETDPSPSGNDSTLSADADAADAGGGGGSQTRERSAVLTPNSPDAVSLPVAISSEPTAEAEGTAPSPPPARGTRNEDSTARKDSKGKRNGDDDAVPSVFPPLPPVVPLAPSASVAYYPPPRSCATSGCFAPADTGDGEGVSSNKNVPASHNEDDVLLIGDTYSAISARHGTDSTANNNNNYKNSNGNTTSTSTSGHVKDSVEHTAPCTGLRGATAATTAAAAAVPDVVRSRLRGRPDDTVSVWRVLRMLPRTAPSVYFGLKVALLVTLPLGLLAFDDERARRYFPATAMMVTIGTSKTNLYLGEQISTSVMVVQAAVWMMAWGTFLDAIGAARHEGAWWGLTFAGMVAVSFTGFRAKRYLMNYMMISGQSVHRPDAAGLSYSAHLASNVLLAAAVSVLQAVLPYPMLVSRRANRSLAECLRKVHSVAVMTRDGLNSGRAFSTLVRAAADECEALSAALDGIPGLLFLAMYEPLERSRYNQLRNVRLTLLQALLRLLRAATAAAQRFTLAHRIEYRDTFVALRAELQPAADAYMDALGNTLAALGRCLEPAAVGPTCHLAELSRCKDELLRANARCHQRLVDAAAVRSDSEGDEEEGEEREEAERLAEEKNVQDEGANEEGSGASEARALHPCGRRHSRPHRRRGSSVTAAEKDREGAAALYTFLYVHTLLALLADELLTFGEQMEAFDPRAFKSTWRRAWEFFFLDHFNDFRHAMLSRVLLRTADDVRSFKDGIKLACAYCVAAAFCLKLNEGEETSNTYFFGMSVLLSIALPTASETIEVGLQRVAGLAFAMMAGYIAGIKTHNKVEAMAVVLSATFLGTALRSNKRYTNAATYFASVTSAAYSISGNRVTMISRVVDNSFAVMAYFFIVTVMFPLSPFKMLWAARTRMLLATADAVALLAGLTTLPPTRETYDVAQARLAIAAARVREMHSALPKLRKLAALCAGEPTLVGKPFPSKSVAATHALLTTASAAMQMWLLGAQLLHRPRHRPRHPLVPVVLAMLEAPAGDLARASRVVLQDLVDSVEAPLRWSARGATERFSDFVRIRDDLEATYRALDLALARETRKAAKAAAAGAGGRSSGVYYGGGSVSGAVSPGNRSGTWQLPQPRRSLAAESPPACDKESNDINNNNNNEMGGDNVEDDEDEEPPFIGRSFIGTRRENCVVVANYGIAYDITQVANIAGDTGADGTDALAERSLAPRTARDTAEAVPMQAPGTAQHGTKTAGTSSADGAGATAAATVSGGGVGTSTIAAAPAAGTIQATVRAADGTHWDWPHLCVSYRAPREHRAVDVDVTAFALMLCSITGLIVALEQIVPEMAPANAFERSRRDYAAAKLSLRHFFLLDSRKERTE